MNTFASMIEEINSHIYVACWGAAAGDDRDIAAKGALDATASLAIIAGRHDIASLLRRQCTKTAANLNEDDIAELSGRADSALKLWPLVCAAAINDEMGSIDNVTHRRDAIFAIRALGQSTLIALVASFEPLGSAT